MEICLGELYSSKKKYKHTHRNPCQTLHLINFFIIVLLQVGGIAQWQGDRPGKYGVLGLITAVAKVKYEF